MSQFPLTCPAAMAVMLLTLTTILVATSHQEHDGHYKSLGTGYSYAYLQIPASEQFFSTRNLFDCTALSLRSQSEFFTYDKLNHLCKNYSPKNIMTVVRTNDTNEIAFYRHSQWIKTYAISKGANSLVYDSFLNNGNPSSWNVDKCIDTLCPNFFRHPILDFWNNLPIDEVKLVAYKNQTAVVTLVFDGRDTTLESWFSLQKLKSSPWSDIHQSPVNYFSIASDWLRRFYVSSNHGGCGIDRGWFAVIERFYCNWESVLRGPALIYSGGDSKITWNHGYEIADSMAVFIRLKS